MYKEFLNLIEEIKKLTHLQTEENEDELEYYFSIINKNGNCYWITFSKDNSEIIVGLDFVHKHFDGIQDKIENGLIFFKELLGADIIITNFLVGDCNYKTKYELKQNDKIETIGITSILFYKFWKKKTIRKEIITAVIDKTCW